MFLPCFDKIFLSALTFTVSKMLNTFTYNANGMKTCKIDKKIKNTNQEVHTLSVLHLISQNMACDAETECSVKLILEQNLDRKV